MGRQRVPNAHVPAASQSRLRDVHADQPAFDAAAQADDDWDPVAPGRISGELSGAEDPGDLRNECSAERGGGVYAKAQSATK